jgi:UDP-N-acetyl-D-mannosaminuronic acid transferase (WecB/TagA/CpsF family)
MQRLGIEWLHRLWRQPRQRARRIFTAVVAFPLAVLGATARR